MLLKENLKNNSLIVYSLIKLGINYICTHPNIYIILFELQLFFLVSDSIIIVTKTGNLPFIFEILCFFSLLHGMYGIYVIIEDYIFNNLIKKVVILLLSIIFLKIICILILGFFQ